MTEIIEGVAPESIEAQALAELQKEGNVIGTEQPQPDEQGNIKDIPLPKEEPKVEEKPEEKTPKEDPKPERTHTMVEAWKLKVAEDQKAGLERDLTDLKAKVEELSKQKSPITVTQKEEIADDIKTMAEEAGVDAEFLTKFANSILAKAKPSEDLQTTIQELKQEKELLKQDTFYSQEFENDVLPLVKEYNLSDTALSQLKTSLKEFAFSETYAKVPLKEIFKLKETAFDFKVSKKSAEGKGVKVRNDIVDIDSISEEDFNKLTFDQIEEFEKKKSSGSWQRK